LVCKIVVGVIGYSSAAIVFNLLDLRVRLISAIRDATGRHL
jgi:hypothetical protein